MLENCEHFHMLASCFGLDWINLLIQEGIVHLLFLMCP